MEVGTAITECPERGRGWWELITTVDQVLQSRTVNTDQPQQPWRERVCHVCLCVCVCVYLSVIMRLHSVIEREVKLGTAESRTANPGSKLPLNGNTGMRPVNRLPYLCLAMYVFNSSSGPAISSIRPGNTHRVTVGGCW